MRQLDKEFDMGNRELCGGPGRHVVWGLDVLTTSKGDELTIGVAPYQPHPITFCLESVEHLAGLRTGRVVAGDDDQLCVAYLGLGKHGVEHGKHAVDVREHRNRVRQDVTIADGTRRWLPRPRLTHQRRIVNAHRETG